MPSFGRDKLWPVQLFNMLSFNYLRKAFLTGLLATTLPEARMSLHDTSYLTLIVKEAICLSRNGKHYFILLAPFAKLVQSSHKMEEGLRQNQDAP